MSGLLGATNPKNGGFEGGTLARNGGNPTQASGSFTSVGTSNTPGQQIGAGSVAFARNNRGSNIRIPYARLVPMRGRGSYGGAAPVSGKADVMEYDGLEPGELAWILGRRLSGGFSGLSGQEAPGGPGSDFAYVDNAMVSASAHALGMGHGVDRLQRLAFTGWIESFFRDQINGAPGDIANPYQGQVISLHDMYLGGATFAVPGLLGPAMSANGIMDSDLAFYQSFLASGTALHAPDVPWICATGLGSHLDSVLESVGAAGDARDVARAAATAADPAAAAKALGYADAATLLSVWGWADAAAAAGDNTTPQLNGLLTPGAPGGALDAEAPGGAGYSAGLQQQGLFIMERGPFLRSKPIGNDACQFPVLPRKPGYSSKIVEASRALGSDLAWSALEAEMRRRHFFDWTPDGIVLSKFESGPNPQADAEIDARMAQLYNVAIQGQAITKSWTGLKDMDVLPMDKVFVVVVADCVYHLEANNRDPDAPGSAVGDQKAAQIKTAKTLYAYEQAVNARATARANLARNDLTHPDAAPLGGGAGPAAPGAAGGNTSYATNIAARQGLGNLGNAGDQDNAGSPEKLIHDYMIKRKQVYNQIGSIGDELTQPQKERVDAEQALDACKSRTDWKDAAQVGIFESVANDVRMGRRAVQRATLRNFRLMRVTSSYLQQYSFHDPDNAKSRCGLKIAAGPKNGGNWDGSQAELTGGIAEYIVGGWCIGTVLDSAASRSTVGNQVRISPSSMAINVNVNVEWWSGDKLYKNFMDKDGIVYRRNQIDKFVDKVPADMTPAAGANAASKPGSYEAGAANGARIKRRRTLPDLDAQNPVSRNLVEFGVGDAEPAAKRVDRFGRALPRPANRGPRDYAKYKTTTDPAAVAVDVGILPRNAF